MENPYVAPSRRITIGSTTADNKKIPLYIGHSDGPGLQNDYGAAIGSLDTSQIGHDLNPVVQGATRQSIFQSNTGAERKAHVKLIVNNFFIYEMKSDNHHPPEDWATFARRLQRYYDNYNNEVMRKHLHTYMLVTIKDDLATAMKTEGKIGLLRVLRACRKKLKYQSPKQQNVLEKLIYRLSI